MRGKIINHEYHKKEKESGKLRMAGGAWSINLQELQGQDIDWIIYWTEKNHYAIPYAKAIDKGFQRVFKDELKLIVPLEHWEIS